MLWHTMLCHAMLCYAMPCHALLTRSSYLLTGFLSFSKLFALPVPLLRQVYFEARKHHYYSTFAIGSRRGKWPTLQDVDLHGGGECKYCTEAAGV